MLVMLMYNNACAIFVNTFFEIFGGEIHATNKSAIKRVKTQLKLMLVMLLN